jgi:hypothetical protein
MVELRKIPYQSALSSATPETPELFYLERWYDYGSPPRLRLTLKHGDDLVYAVASNGQGQIQVELSPRPPQSIYEDPPPRSTSTFSPAVEARLLPLLRQPYTTLELMNPMFDPALGSYILPTPLDLFKLIKDNQDALLPLGSTMALDRPAWLLSLPYAEREYLLSIDQETYALLDLQLLPEQSGGEPLHLWRATALEVLESVEDDRFTLGGASWGEQVDLPPTLAVLNPRFSPQVEQSEDFPVVLPDTIILSDSMRLLMPTPDSLVSLIRDEFTVINISQLNDESVVYAGGEIDWQQAGKLRYYIIEQRVSGSEYQPTYAIVDLEGLLGPDRSSMVILLSQPFSAPDDHRILLRRLISSLEVADERRLRAYFKP